jgi:hypothetical protein
MEKTMRMSFNLRPFVTFKLLIPSLNLRKLQIINTRVKTVRKIINELKYAIKNSIASVLFVSKSTNIDDTLKTPPK